MKNAKPKILIGRTDVVDFPKLDLLGIDIKIDSGAYTSSIHCHHIIEENNILKCLFLDPKHQDFHQKPLIFSDFKQKNVKSSNGVVEKRYLIKTEILIFNRIRAIELTITERGSMRFPVLLGRKFLSRKFIIDTSKKDLSLTNNITKI
ncbi:RimK/LysX family protein [Lutibacter sp.]|uniref:ATP-dependent zinc protease family protein n=1 Tax=Lutibacter sp. TaxID=1925666 RepID=UPI002734559F|nr:RimK/LysX family protein [Lutibacter sp.]MDP3313875.1 RimK/LysX family protein [Lutibacter sp.]